MNKFPADHVPDRVRQFPPQYLRQVRSVPSCTSLGCKTDSSAFPHDFDGTTSDWGHSNEHWQPDAAGSVGERNLPNLFQRRSVPACTSLGCKTGSIADGPKPKDYDVPNFGIDHDIEASNKNLKDAEATFGPWNPVFKKDGESLTQVRMRSTPSCSSVKCYNESIVKPEADFVPYQVPQYPSEKFLRGEANW